MYRKFTWRRDGQRWNQIQRVKRQHTENKHEEREHTHRKYTRVWRITKARREDNKTWNTRWNNGNIKRAERTWQVRDAPQELSDFQKEVLIFCRCFLRCSAVRLPRQTRFQLKLHFYFHFPFNLLRLCAGVPPPICQLRPGSWFCICTQKTVVVLKLFKLVFL